MLRGLAALPARVLADPIRRGRLRDVGWPYGLRSVVVLAVVAYVIGAGLAATSGLVRGNSELTAPTSDVGSVPRAWLWLVLLVVVVALALFQTAALHLPGWLKIIALLSSLVMMASWGLRYSETSGGLIETVLTAVAMLGLVVFVVLRWRREFAWWEFPLVWLLLASTVVVGVVALDRSAGPLGYDFVPAYLRSTVVSLIPVALPAAVAAGLSVAEITVSATLWSTTALAKARSARTVYLVLAAVVVARMIQAGWQLWHGDAADLGWPVLRTWALLLAALAGISALLVALARSSGRRLRAGAARADGPDGPGARRRRGRGRLRPGGHPRRARRGRSAGARRRSERSPRRGRRCCPPGSGRRWSDSWSESP